MLNKLKGKYHLYLISLVLFSAVLVGNGCKKTDSNGWTTYRHDTALSGVTEEQLPEDLSLSWVFNPGHPPKPAWPKPAEELPRVHSDNAFHVTASGGKAFFGSSVDNKIYALDITTGEIKWTFYTEGPVRFAPTVWKNRVYAGSDDGFVYCLKAGSGKLEWKYRAGPHDEKVIGNGRMISLWPVRTNILIHSSTAYFAAGVFPYEGIFICALDAGNGKVIWKNDTIGDRAHELAWGGISPQGYLVASENTLYVPSGRALPAAFDRRSGQFLYYMEPGSKFGGTWAILRESELITGAERSGTPAKGLYDTETGERKGDAYAWHPGIDMVIAPQYTYIVTEEGLTAIKRSVYENLKKKLQPIQEERTKLREQLADIRTKMQEATGTSLENLKQQMDNSLSRLSDLDKEEEKLKDASFIWKYPQKDLCSLILAGNKVYAGGEGFVTAVEVQKGKEIWSEKLDGRAHGLAAADGSLFVCTDTGNIYCFKDNTGSAPLDIKPEMVQNPYAEDRGTDKIRTAAEEILKESGSKKGYCLILGSGTGRLAYELAKKTEFQIIAIEKNEKILREARTKLAKTGLLGTRIFLENWELDSLPDYFANFILSEEMLLSGRLEYSLEEVYRVLRPGGGMALLKSNGDSSNPQEKTNQTLEKFKSGEKIDAAFIKQEGSWIKITRPELEGIGDWTQQFGNPQNTACSEDQLVKGPLGVLWYGEPGPQRMVERHAKAASPVSINGRLFVQGEEVLMAYDAYNGTLLWEREIPGAVRARADVDGGNMAASEDALYVAAEDKCFRLDPETGKTLMEYSLPPSSQGIKRRWGYISYSEGILYGSASRPLKEDYAALWKAMVQDGKWKNLEEIPEKFRIKAEQYINRYPVPNEKAWLDFQRAGDFWRWLDDYPQWENYNSSTDSLSVNIKTSDKIFALDPDSKEFLWIHQGKNIANISISIGEGCIAFAESAVSGVQKQRALENRRQLTLAGIYQEAKETSGLYAGVDVRTVVCLDAKTGEKNWEKTLDFTGCGGDFLGSALYDGLLLFFSNMGSHDAWRFKDDTLTWKRITTLEAATGAVKWSKPLNYRTRPVIINGRLILEPYACDPHTAEILTRPHPITGKPVPWEFLRPGHTCALTSASAHTLFYRSSSTAFYDVEEDRGLTLFGGIRPGCLINLIPANGLLLFPEASSGCTCSFPLRCSIVFKHKAQRTWPWTVFITQGPLTPVKHFAINLGAPADMKDEEGSVWFGYPNPKTVYTQNHFPDYGVKFDLEETILDDMGYFARDFRNVTYEGTDKPWLFTSGCLGLLKCTIPLLDNESREQAEYTVRLGFIAQPGDRIGKRVFDIKIQGQPVQENFDILKEAGNPGITVIKEFRAIKAGQDLTLELVPKIQNAAIEEAPLINFIEVLRLP